MDSRIERFLTKINFDKDKYECFETAVLKNCIVDNEKCMWKLYISLEKQIDIDTFKILKECSKSLENVNDVFFYFEVKSYKYLKEYFYYILDKIIENCPMIESIIKDEFLKFANNNITIEVFNEVEKNKIESVKSNIILFLKDMGFKDVIIEVKLNEEARLEFKESIKKEDVIKKEEKPKNDIILGSFIDSEITSLKNIITDMDSVTVEAFVFGIDVKTTSSAFTIVTLKISDKTDSIVAKVFLKTKEDVKRVTSEIKEGDWYRIRGRVQNDNFLRDLSLSIKDIMKIKSKSSNIVDNAEKKRVELHVHTTMSGMDGLIDYKKDIFKKVSSLGHTAVGIVDKNTCQAFPKLYKNKGDIKVLFGSELYVVNDDFSVVKRGNDTLISENTYIVFDFETTGFNAGGGDSIIEIGAVKVENGEITDRFDELINPGVKLKKVITDLTHITDEMLADKDTEENAFKRFKEFYKDYPMVAHNAKFDTSFVESCYKKYNLGVFNNPVIDTMELSKVLNPDISKHSLSACVKRYDVEFDEEGHHRADYDAEATGKVLLKMFKSLNTNIKTLNDLNTLVDKNEIHKLSRPFHISVFALNDTGLQNLFKLVSLANTKYLYKTPRILKSEIEKAREGLLIGSGCVNGEIFEAAKSKTEDELMNLMDFYDFIEVNPPSIQEYLIETSDFANKFEVEENIKKIISASEKVNKIVCATGDVHTLNKEDNIHREILVHQKIPGGGFHPLNRSNIKHIPNAYFMTTEEMLNEFKFLGEEKAYEIVVENTNKVADMFTEEVHVLNPGLNSPKMENSAQITRDMVFNNAKSVYGENLPPLIEERLEKELGGIIGGEYDVIYLIAQKLVQKSNEDGYLVGSRGSVGSSLVATFMNITEVNPLPPHYVCPKCKKSIFEIDGESLNIKYGSGFDLPDRKCECGEMMNKQGQDIPFETFLGFNADKTPDIDLNFSGEYQSKAHDYTKVLFGEDKVFRAGTVSTIAEKTAYGFVKIYLEEKGINLRSVEIERLAKGITGIKRTTGQHPGGIVVVPDYKDILDFTPYQYPAENTSAAWYTTHFEYHDIEENLLKLDILGHDDPTVLKYLSDDTKININDIPLDDQKVLSIFSSPDALGVTKEQIMCETGTLGIPEFGTNFVVKMLEETRPKTFAELIKISGLSHGTDVWNGNARDLILNKTCEFKEVIGCRDDIMVYLIKCGIDKGNSFKISEFIRKGKSVKEPENWEIHKKTMKDANVPDWYIMSCEKIKYMFPKAHASAYVTMAFRVAWFKVYYPLNYYRVYLSIRRSDFDLESMSRGEDAIKEAITNLLSKGYDASNKESAVLDSLKVALEMCVRGYYFTKIDIEKSDAIMFKITEDGKGLIPPFLAIDGMGDVAAKKIVEERNNRPYVSIEDLQNRGKISASIIDKLREWGCLNDLPESSQLSLF